MSAARPAPDATAAGPARPPRPLRAVLTANAAWNALNYRRPLIAALQADGWEVVVLAPADAAVAGLAAMGVRHVPLAMDPKGLSPLADARLVLRMRRALRALAPDVVLSFTIKNNLYGALAARPLGIPFIPNVSGLGFAFQSAPALRRLVEALYRRAFRHLPTVFFQNPDDRALFLDRRLVAEAQAGLLPGSGVDLARFAPLPLPEGPPAFVLVARLLRDKGVEDYVEAARRIRADRPDVTFRLLGPAGVASRSAIGADAVAAWAAEGAVEYLGEAADVRPALAAATALVLPSRGGEGTPRALLEGAAMGRPLVATDVPGSREVVEDGVNGLLCAPRDPASLEAALRRLIALAPEARATMGEAARRTAEARYDERLVVAAYRAAIARVLARAADANAPPFAPPFAPDARRAPRPAAAPTGPRAP